MKRPSLDDYDKGRRVLDRDGSSEREETAEGFDASVEDVQDYIEYVREHTE